MAEKRINAEEIYKIENKKIKLENQIINNSLNNNDYTIKDKQIATIFKIFNSVKAQIENEGKTLNQNNDTEDGIKDIILLAVEQIYKFLQQDIDSLNLPNIIKKALKTLKTIVNFVRAVKDHGQN